MKALNLLESISKNIAVNNPELKPFADAFNEVIKANEKQLQDYKTWEQYKQTILLIMGFIPATLPYIGLVSLIFDIIIAMIKAENKK